MSVRLFRFLSPSPVRTVSVVGCIVSDRVAWSIRPRSTNDLPGLTFIIFISLVCCHDGPCGSRIAG